MLRERAKAEKRFGEEQDATGEDFDEEDYRDDDYDEDYDDDDDDDDHHHCHHSHDAPHVSDSVNTRQLKEMSITGALLRRALKTAIQKESQFEAGNMNQRCSSHGSLCSHFFAALATASPQLPNADNIGPLQLSAMASASTAHSKKKLSLKQTHAQAARAQGATAAFHVVKPSTGTVDESDSQSSWGDGSSTEEVCPSLQLRVLCRSSLNLW